MQIGWRSELGKVDSCGPYAHDVVLADLNQDGFSDLISAHDDGLRIGFSQADGTFALPVIDATPEGRRLAVADVDDDNRLDIVMTSKDRVTLYLQDPRDQSIGAISRLNSLDSVNLTRWTAGLGSAAPLRSAGKCSLRRMLDG